MVASTYDGDMVGATADRAAGGLMSTLDLALKVAAITVGVPVSGRAGWLLVDSLMRWQPSRPRPSTTAVCYDGQFELPPPTSGPFPPPPPLTDRGLDASRIGSGPLRLTKHPTCDWQKCSSCHRKCKKHLHSTSWANELGSGYTLCDDCFAFAPAADRDDWSKWMGSDIVRG